jgi:hypothetical protein
MKSIASEATHCNELGGSVTVLQNRAQQFLSSIVNRDRVVLYIFLFFSGALGKCRQSGQDHFIPNLLLVVIDQSPNIRRYINI